MGPLVGIATDPLRFPQAHHLPPIHRYLDASASRFRRSVASISSSRPIHSLRYAIHDKGSPRTAIFSGSTKLVEHGGDRAERAFQLVLVSLFLQPDQ
jgi:hypothetical protein